MLPAAHPVPRPRLPANTPVGMRALPDPAAGVTGEYNAPLATTTGELVSVVHLAAELAPFARSGGLVGIANGIDQQVGDPETDALIARNYSVDDLAGKRRCRVSLQRAVGLRTINDVPISRCRRGW